MVQRKKRKRTKRTFVFPLTRVLIVGITTTGYCGGQKCKLVQKNIRWVNVSLNQSCLLERAFCVQGEDHGLTETAKLHKGKITFILTFHLSALSKLLLHWTAVE